jgi:predicted Zn-dependent protease
VSLPRGNPRIPEGINAHNENPLREFLTLALGVSLALVVLVFILSVTIKLIAPYIPFAWELSAAPPLQAFAGAGKGANREATAALQSLSAGLLDSSLRVPIKGRDAANIVPPEHFRFSLITLNNPNAFATLGAQIAVTDSLLQHVSSENGLAMVLAHEIAHVQLRHPIEAAGRGIVVQIVLAALLGDSGANLLGGSLSAGGMLTLLSFNRDMEMQADRRALEILRAHFGHVGGADEFFRDMAANPRSADWLEFAQTHPSSKRRLERIRQAISKDTVTLPTLPMPTGLR